MRDETTEKNIYEFLDYREFLRYVYELRNQTSQSFTYRSIAQKLNMHHSLVARIFRGERHISDKSIHEFAKVIGLKKLKRDYFSLLVTYGKSDKPEVIKECFEKMMHLKPVKVMVVQDSEYRLFKNWYSQAIHGVLEFFPFSGDYRALSQKLSPAITISEAKEGIEVLKNLNFIAEDDDGNWRPVNAHLTSGDRWKSAAIHSYHKEILALASNSLDIHRKDQRDFSSLTISMDSEDVPVIKEILKKTRDTIVKTVGRKDADKSDSVFQLALNFFPMSRLEVKR
ncbi:MAG: TIGR02147 family protein [Fibrobacterales bacterium]